MPVGLHVDRSLEQMIAALGILKAGAGCLPLDPSYPRERLEFMRADSGVPHVVTRADLEAARRHGTARPDVTIAEDDLLYVLYTSGSTGRPKGVLFPHRILANLVRWGLDHHLFDAPARTLQFAPINFDVSFQEIFTCWASGGTLVLIDDERRRDPESLLAHVKARSIERMFLAVRGARRPGRGGGGPCARRSAGFPAPGDHRRRGAALDAGAPIAVRAPGGLRAAQPLRPDRSPRGHLGTSLRPNRNRGRRCRRLDGQSPARTFMSWTTSSSPCHAAWPGSCTSAAASSRMAT